MVEWCVTKMGECEVRDWKEQGPNICFPQEKVKHEKLNFGQTGKRRKPSLNDRIFPTNKG